MIRKNNLTSPAFLPSLTRPNQVTASSVAGLYSQLSAELPDLDKAPIFDDKTGFIRFLPCEPLNGLIGAPYTGNPMERAQAFLATDTVSKLLGTSTTNLVGTKTDDIMFGGTKKMHRVEFQQLAHLADGTDVPVHGGMVHVTMDDNGNVVNVTSTIELGNLPRKIGKVITPAVAVAKALRKLPKHCSDINSQCKLELSEHNGKIDLVYAVTLTCKAASQFFLVLARSGKIVHQHDLRLYSVTSPDTAKGLSRIPIRCFLSIPDPKTPIGKQVRDHYLENLPDPKFLKNERYDMKVQKNGQWETVQAKADGTFNFDPESSDQYERSCFSAVVTFAQNEQDIYYEQHGGVKVPNPIPVFMDDPDVRDNAYFDPSGWEIHMGIGSGLQSGGLNVHISWDMGVGWHENGHKRCAAQTPGRDMPGPQGGGANEGLCGDVLGDLLIETLFMVKFAKELGHTLTVGELKASRGIIGKYALPPDGIRQQKNTKKYPDDIAGEVHDDGLIIGGGTWDLLVAIATDGKKDSDPVAQKDLDTFCKLTLAMLALLPARKVTFKDILKAFYAADKTLFSDAHKSLIEAAMKPHGITLTMKENIPMPTEPTDEDGPGDGDDDGEGTPRRRRRSPKKGPKKGPRKPKKGPKKSPKKGPSRRKTPRRKTA